MAVAAAAERGFFGFGMAVEGGGFFLEPDCRRISAAKAMPGSPTALDRVAGRKAKELIAAAERDVGETLHLKLDRANGQVYSVALVAVPRPD